MSSGVKNFGPASREPGSGGAGLFPKTLWSEVRAAAATGADESFRAISKLCERYRRPLLLYLQRRAGREEAEDLLQGFLVKLVDRRFYDSLAPDKGRFRTFLVTCLRNHLRDEFDKRRARKRGGGASLASLDETSTSGQPAVQAADTGPSPDVEFDRAWARTILHRAFNKLESEQRRAGKENFFREAKALLLGANEETEVVARRLKMSAGSFRVAVHRLKGRLGELVTEQVQPTVASPEDLQSELLYLTELFGLKQVSRQAGE
jgi:RNA polymerase sigma-70 factor (ECF subfamily)